jgi:hypothetical protein
MSEISGLHELDARIAALHWIARSVDMPPAVARRIVAMAEVFAEARGMVARDYVAAPEAEREPSTQASRLQPVQQITAETRRLAQAALEALDEYEPYDTVPDDDAAGAKGGVSSPSGHAGSGPFLARTDAASEESARWDKPARVPSSVIRKWAQAQGITCPAAGPLSAALLNIINDRRRMLRLRPFVQAAAPADGDA